MVVAAYVCLIRKLFRPQHVMFVQYFIVTHLGDKYYCVVFLLFNYFTVSDFRGGYVQNFSIRGVYTMQCS